MKPLARIRVSRMLAFMPFLAVFAAIVGITLSNPLYDRARTVRDRVVDGRIDLSGNSEGITELVGRWGFRWKALVLDPRLAPPDCYAPLPGSWFEAGVRDRFGFASYSLMVTGLIPGEEYALRVGQTLSACAVVVNGAVVARIGEVGRSRATEVPAWDSRLARFRARDDGTASVVLQVSNYHDRVGGSNASLYVGKSALLSRAEERRLVADALVFAALSGMGLFFLGLYAAHRRNRVFLWVAVLSLVTALRSLCYDRFALLTLAPGLPWPFFFRLGYVTFPAIIVSFLAFLRAMYPSLVTRARLLVAASPFLAYSACVIGAPEYLSAMLLSPLEACGLIAVLGGMATICIAWSRSLPHARALFAVFAVASAAFAYDVMVSMWIVPGASLGHLGMCLSLFAIAFLVTALYDRSFEETRALSTQLRAMNAAIGRFVPSGFLDVLNKDAPETVERGDSVEREMAVMSADIRSFSAIAERLDAREVFAFLNEFLELVGPIVRANGGFIARYEGDGVLALFPNGAESAVRCAVQMQSAFARRNRERPGRNQLIVGIGIDSGKIALGAIGDGSSLNGAIISACVARAERFERASREFNARILINGAVFLSLHDPLSWFLRPIDRIEVGGAMSFLFEVYNNDPETLRELKWKTQDTLERALYAFFSGQKDEARAFFARVSAVFPEDPVIQHYTRRLH